MKVAICIRGELRSWFAAKDNIFDVFKNLNPDYFFTTWDKNYNTETDVVETVSHEEIIKSFGNQKLMGSKVIDINIKHSHRVDAITYVMAKQMSECNNLKRKYEIANKFNYDYVICIRPDVVYEGTISYNDLICRSTDIFTLSSYEQVKSNSLFLGVYTPDVFFFGSSFIIDIVSDFYHYLPYIHKDRVNYKKDTTHNTFTDYLLNNRIMLEHTDNIFLFGHILRRGVDFDGKITEKNKELIIQKNKEYYAKNTSMRMHTNLITNV